MEPYPSLFVGRMDGSLVLSVRGGEVLHVDESTGEFSTYALLPAGSPAARQPGLLFVYGRWNLRVVGRDDDGGGTGGGVRLARIVGSDMEVLRCVPAGSGGGGTVVTVERTVNLPQLTSVKARLATSSKWRFMEMVEGVVVPAGCVLVSTHEDLRWMFTVDVETMKLERRRRRKQDLLRLAFPHEFPWPPPIKCAQTSKSHKVY